MDKNAAIPYLYGVVALVFYKMVLFVGGVINQCICQKNIR